MATRPTGIPENTNWHPKCGAWWTGTSASHCARCCHTFSGTSAFDQHWKHVADGADCRDPEAAGLVPVAKPYGVLWSWPAREGGEFWTSTRLAAVSERIVLPNEAFDELAATLDQPAEVVPELVELFKHNRTVASGTES